MGSIGRLDLKIIHWSSEKPEYILWCNIVHFSRFVLCSG